MKGTKIIQKKVTDLIYDFNETTPYIALQDHRTEKVDPFPAYPHDLKLVKECVRNITSLFPISWNVTFYVLPYEFLSRTNAYAQSMAHNYDKKKKELNGEEFERTPYIVLSGKRIPIMPPMTRYLIPHEYGHIVESWIAAKRGKKSTELLNDYSKMRKISFPKSYAGNWHRSPGEIFANDFRIVVGLAEVEFWPHPCKHPLEVQSVIDWWDIAREFYKS
jgi:hypothetical protein